MTVGKVSKINFFSFCGGYKVLLIPRSNLGYDGHVGGVIYHMYRYANNKIIDIIIII